MLWDIIIIIIIIIIALLLWGGPEGLQYNKTRTRYPSNLRTVEGKEMMEMDRARVENNTIIIFMMRGEGEIEQ